MNFNRRESPAKRGTSDRQPESAIDAGNAAAKRTQLVVRGTRAIVKRLAEAYILIPVFTGLLLCIAWAAVFHLISVEGDVAEDTAAQSSREIADTYEAQLVRNLSSIDQTLKTVKYAYESKGGTAMDELQAKGLLPPSIVFRVSVAGADGSVFAASGSHGPSNVSTDPCFAALRAQIDASMPCVSRVSLNHDTDTPEITFSRRLERADGSFNGSVMLAMDPAYFTSGYEYARMGDKGMLLLAGTDGVVRAQQTGESTSWGRSISTVAIAVAQQALASGARVGPWDQGVRRYTTIRAIHGFPLIAMVGLSQGEQLSVFRKHRHNYVLWTAIASALLIVLAAALSRSSWQLAVSRRRARQAQQTYYAASERSLDAFFVFRSERDGAGNLLGFVMTDANRRGSVVLGLPREMLVGRSLDAIFPDARQNGMFDEFAAVAETGTVHEHEWMHLCTDDTKVWLQRQVVRVDNGVVAIMRDISSRKRAEVRRAEHNRVLEMIATSTPLEEVLSYLASLLESQISRVACVALLRDDDGLHLKLGAAPGLSELYRKRINGSPVSLDAGPSGRAIHTRRPVYIPDASKDPAFMGQMQAYGLSGFQACWAIPILAHDGSALGALTLFAQDAHEPSAIESQVIAMGTRIAGIAIERHRAEERIRHMANHDALTGLPNRTLLSDRLNQVLLHARRYERGVSVVFIDLDNFKLINDSLGHRAGDDLLRTVAARMSDCLRATDTVVRLGGDEFVIVLFDDDQNGPGIHKTIEKIRERIMEPVELNGEQYRVTCSMGVASYPADGANAESLLMNADAAMYRAKELGRNNYQMYTHEMNIKVHEKLRLQEQLRVALSNGEFHLEYQPQVDLRTESVFGVEALLRWQHPTDGNISPATFIPVAEETGLIISIGDWVLHKACMQNKLWQDMGFAPMTVSVNVSARQFLQKELVSRVAHALSESGLDPQYLELELTESVIMQDLDGAIATMRQLQEMGVRLSIDDFGTGYSSLSALKHFPIVRLKIDQSFVRELPGKDDDRAIAMAVISLGRQLNLKVIAEGVETETQLAFLRDNACNEIQGYHYSRPLKSHDLEQLLSQPFVWPVAAAALVD
ncbi:MAG: EAL domain-containing protein [Pseudomonadota bacterium]|nr:EAL domain-containing protein [Pseudomonadota bacterium]